jgi:NitT/TauT family transport system permease protein
METKLAAPIEETPAAKAAPQAAAQSNRLKAVIKLAVGFVQSTIVPIVLLVAWEILSDTKIINPQILPPPSQVLAKWWEYAKPSEAFDAEKSSYVAWLFSGELVGDAIASMYRVIGGFLIGTCLALPLGLFMGASNKVYKLFNPLLQVLRPIPPIAYIPLSILWFGLGNPPAFFLIALGAFFPVLMNTISGVRHVDSIYIRAARNLGASGSTMFLRVILPAATPYILTGVRVGIGVAFIVVIVAEMIAVNNGLGYRILEAREFFWSDKIIAGMISIGLLGLGLDTLMNKLNNYLLRWYRGMEHN